MPNGGDVGVDFPESVRTMADHLHLIVHALQRAVRDADLGPGQDSVDVMDDHPGKLHEGRQSRATGRLEPLGQIGASPAGILARMSAYA